MSFLEELKRRQVIKVGIAYVILAWLLVQVASILVPALRVPEWTTSFVVLLLILGFPISLLLAWAYELTPDGVQRTGTDSQPGFGATASRKLNTTIIGLLVAALAFVALDQYVLEEQRSGPRTEPSDISTEASVAVLPFVSMSTDQNQEYFSEGISEELLNTLSRIPGLRVPSRTSSFSFKDTTASLASIGTELAVGYVLEGSVRRDGERVRVLANLVDVRTNSSLWSESFERELTSIFEIQDEIAGRVAEALEVRLLGRERLVSSARRTTNVEAHDAYLQGLSLSQTLRSDDVLAAIDSFERAIALDPEYVAAYTRLAEAHTIARRFDYIDGTQSLKAATAAVDRALELDPNFPDAYFERGQLNQARGNFAGAIADFVRAGDLGLKDAALYLSQSTIYGILEQTDEAREALEQAVNLDPRSATLNWLMGNLRLNLRNPSEAREFFERSIRYEPTSPIAYGALGDIAMFNGRLDETVRWYVEGLKQDPGHGHMNAWVGLTYLSLGDEQRATAWLERGASLIVSSELSSYVQSFESLIWHDEDPEGLAAMLQSVSRGAMGPFGTRPFRKPMLRVADSIVAEAYYRERWPLLFAETPDVRFTNFEVVPDVAYLLRMQGQNELAEDILNQALEIFYSDSWQPPIPVDPVIFLTEVELLTLLGREDDALDALRREIDEGWRWGWWEVERDPVLAGLRERPEFSAMLDEVKSDLQAQLATMPSYEPSDLR